MRRPAFHPQRASRLRAFTILEVLVSATVSVVIMAGVYGLMQTGLLLSVKSLATNNTSTTARLGIDRAQTLIQSAYETPRLIESDGTVTTGSSPAPGLKFFRYVGGPYVVTVPKTGLSGETTSITVTRDNGAQVLPPAPLPSDAFIINTTILMSGTANQVRAYIGSTNKAITSSTTGSKVTYTVALDRQLVGNNGMISYDATTTVTAILVRPTALAVVPTAKGRELRYYESFPESNQFNFNAKHAVLTNQVSLSTATAAPSASDAMNDVNARPFSLEELDGRTFVKADLRIRDNRYNRYLLNKEEKEFSSYTELSSLFTTKCNPDE